MTSKLLSVVALAACALSAAAQNTVAVRFGKLWDGAHVIDGALVIIQGDRIRSVSGGNPSPPPGATLIDWSRYYGLPGLIDVHTHMTYYWDRQPGTLPRGQARMPAVLVFLAQENARKTLEAGVTTVRDLGSQDYDDIAMRDLINMGAMVGPRMFVCGYGLMSLAVFAPAPRRRLARHSRFTRRSYESGPPPNRRRRGCHQDVRLRRRIRERRNPADLHL